MALDAEQLTALYEAEGPRILAFATRWTFDPEAGLDAVGETFALAFEQRARFRGSTREEAVGWLFAICRTVLSRRSRRFGSERRALHRLGVELPTMGEEERARVEELASLEELRAAVLHGLHGLPDGQRDALQLRIVEELDYPAVAERLGVSQPTARARVSRGLRTLAESLTVLEEVPDA